MVLELMAGCKCIDTGYIHVCTCYPYNTYYTILRKEISEI